MQTPAIVLILIASISVLSTLIGAAASFGATALVESKKHKNAKAERWRNERVAAHVEFMAAMEPLYRRGIGSDMESILRGILDDLRKRGDDVADDSRDYQGADLVSKTRQLLASEVALSETLSTAYQRMVLLASSPTIEAANEFREAAVEAYRDRTDEAKIKRMKDSRTTYVHAAKTELGTND